MGEEEKIRLQGRHWRRKQWGGFYARPWTTEAEEGTHSMECHECVQTEDMRHEIRPLWLRVKSANREEGRRQRPMGDQCSEEDETSDQGKSCVDRLMRANAKEMERLTPALVMGQKVGCQNSGSAGGRGEEGLNIRQQSQFLIQP